MKRSTELRLVRESIERIQAGRADEGEGMARLDVARYVSTERFDAERAMMRRYPLLVGYSAQVSNPGDFFTHSATDVPLLVVRDEEGALRAFVNACRHRGTLVEGQPCGAGRKRFTCPYHHWTYDLRGRLRGMPHAYGFTGLDHGERGLVELPVGERFGAVFVLPTPGLHLDLDAYLGELGDELAGFLDGHVPHAPSERTRALNWKLVMDGSFEAYHFKFAHARTIAPLFCDNVARMEWQRPHVRAVLPKRSMAELAGTEEDSWRLRDHANIIYGLFPNSLVLVQPDHAMVASVWPVAVDRSILSGTMLIPQAPADEKAARYWARNEAIFWDAIEEDLDMGERIQRTLRSGANDHLLFASFEHIVAAFHEVVDEALATDGLEAQGRPSPTL